MAYTDNNTIGLNISSTSPYFEGIVDVAPIFPGMLCKMTATSTDIPNIRPHDQAGLLAEKLFAVENPGEGKEIWDSYPVGDRVFMRLLRAGDIFLAYVYSAGPMDEGDYLESNGDGAIRKRTDPADDADLVAVLLESYTEIAQYKLKRVRAL